MAQFAKEKAFPSEIFLKQKKIFFINGNLFSNNRKKKLIV